MLTRLLGLKPLRFNFTKKNERAQGNMGRLGSTCPLLAGRLFANHSLNLRVIYMVIKLILRRFQCAMSGFDWFSILVNIHDFRLCTPKNLVMPSARSLITFC